MKQPVKIKLSQPNGEVITHTFENINDLRSAIENWKVEFRLKNRTDERLKNGRSDWSYQMYCETFDDILEKAIKEG